MDREHAQLEFDRLLRPYTFAPGCGDRTVARPIRPARPATAALNNELMREYPGAGSPAPRPGVLGQDIIRDYPGAQPPCPPRREADRLGDRSAAPSPEEALREWVCENVVRQIVLTAEQVAAMYSDPRVGVSSWLVQSYRDGPATGGSAITMQIAVVVQGRAPAEVFNVVASIRDHAASVTITRGSGVTYVTGLERREGGTSEIRTTSRMTAGAPSVVGTGTRPAGQQPAIRQH